jgi:deoxyribodipyrimidine photo-lyase
MTHSNTDLRRIYARQPEMQKSGGVVYRMSRDQRADDNWALLFAAQLAQSLSRPLMVVFTLMPGYPGACSRHFDFMLAGLLETEDRLKELNIPFYILTDDDPQAALHYFVFQNNICAVVSDFDPLRHKQAWGKSTDTFSGTAHYEVDTHNIVPCRQASSKAEFGAYTIRPKIKRLLPEFLTPFPELQKQPPIPPVTGDNLHTVRHASALCGFNNIERCRTTKAGSSYALKILEDFLQNRLKNYDTDRNDPGREGQSGLSPYLHFGQLSAQRVALEALKMPPSAGREAFLEELITRRELSDNFCFYNAAYDSPAGFPEWAKQNIELHRNDIREYWYDLSTLEKANTHDKLWNAAQIEMAVSGKMHGYLRMYWAKKILEWTPSVETAMRYAIYLNDTYSLDGRDPNGYAGIAWSMGGVHDRAWFSRPVFGRIRYMNYSGCRKKFDTNAYIKKWQDG